MPVPGVTLDVTSVIKVSVDSALVPETAGPVVKRPEAEYACQAGPLKLSTALVSSTQPLRGREDRVASEAVPVTPESMVLLEATAEQAVKPSAARYAHLEVF